MPGTYVFHMVDKGVDNAGAKCREVVSGPGAVDGRGQALRPSTGRPGLSTLWTAVDNGVTSATPHLWTAVDDVDNRPQNPLSRSNPPCAVVHTVDGRVDNPPRPSTFSGADVDGRLIHVSTP